LERLEKWHFDGQITLNPNYDLVLKFDYKINVIINILK